MLTTLNFKFNEHVGKLVGKLVGKFKGINIVASNNVPQDEIWLENNGKIIKFKLITEGDKK